MRRRQRRGEPEVCERGHAARLGGVEGRVGGDDADGGVRLAESRRDAALAELARRVHQPVTGGRFARAGQEGSGRGVAHVTERVDRDQRADGAAATWRLAVPRPPFMARASPKALPTDAPAPAPTEPSANGPLVAAAAARAPMARSGRTPGAPTARS